MRKGLQEPFCGLKNLILIFKTMFKSDDKNQKEKSFRLANMPNLNKRTKIILLFIVFIAIILIVGNYHIVLNATDITRPFIFIERPYWGFSDIIGDINICTEAPYYSIMSNHPSLCRALQNAGYLESEKARDKRIQQEAQQKFNDSFSEEFQKLDQNNNQQAKTEDKPAPTTTPAPTQVKQTDDQNITPTSSETVSQKNAVAKAKSYLGYSAFSHDGLVDQLEYEQFSHTDAVYGADNSGANWNKQAAKKAKSYMEYSAFSRGSLIEQLKYDKFTQEQAEYGANEVGL